jgi:hypothetical protein
MCLRRAPEKYIAGAALDRAAVRDSRLGESQIRQQGMVKSSTGLGPESET